MNADAAHAYVVALSEQDASARKRTFTCLCIDLGADLGSFQYPPPTYLKEIAVQANGRGAIRWTDEFSVGALLATAGVASGANGSKRPAPGKGREKYGYLIDDGCRVGHSLTELDVAGA